MYLLFILKKEWQGFNKKRLKVAMDEARLEYAFELENLGKTIKSFGNYVIIIHDLI
jgi:hypothetical protein